MVPRCKETNSISRFQITVIIVVAWFALNGVCLHAQSPKIEAAIDTSELFIGETITYQVEIQNVEHPTPPDLSGVEELFDVELAGDQSLNQSSTLIINGRMSQQNLLRHVYVYKLTPMKSGKLVIPPVSITLDGKVIRSNSVSLSIQDLEVQDVVIGQTIVEHTTVYPTQSFSVTLRVMIKGLPKSSEEPLSVLARRRRLLPHLQVEWLRPIDGLKATEMSDWLSARLSKDGVGFTLNDVDARSGAFFSSAAVLQLLVGREKRLDANGELGEYFVYELVRSFTAEKPGTYTFGTSMIKGTFVTGLEGREFKARRIVALAPSASIEVKEVPTPRPRGYTGGIGNYQVEASAHPVKLRVGDPLTFTVAFERGPLGGSLDLISAPNLSDFSDIVENFEIVDTSPTGRVDAGQKKFAYALRPKNVGVSLPALSFTSFDPAKESFVELTTQAVALTVEDASRVQNEEIVGSTSKSLTSTSEMRSNEKGIYQNVTDVSLLANESIDWRLRFAFVGGSWGILGVMSLGIAINRKRSSDQTGQRRQRAARVAHQRLNEASALKNNPREMLRMIRTGMVGLVADTTSRFADGMTVRDVAHAIQLANLSDQEHRDAIELLAELDAVEYGAVSSLEPNEALRRAVALVPKLATSLSKRIR